MAFKMSGDDRIGAPDLQLYAVDTTARLPVGTIIRAVDDAGVLGDAEFIYMQASVAYTAGQAVIYRNGPSAVNLLALYATHRNSGRSIAFALTAIAASSYGWFQIGGVVTAVCAAAGADAVAMLSAVAGSISSAVLAGGQIIGANFNSAFNTPAAGFAYLQINRPSVQTQIT